MRAMTLTLAILAGGLTACGSDTAGDSTALATPVATDAFDPPVPGNGPASQRDCFWAATSDDVLANVLFQDVLAKYWVAVLPSLPAGELSIQGHYPHARYMSYHLYNHRLEPIDALADVEIIPDGGANPFAPGADRSAPQRDYVIRVSAAVPPEDPGARDPNTMYAYAQLGEAQNVPAPAAVLIYRIYAPDEHRDRAGDVPLPRIRYTLPGGTTVEGAEACALLEPLLPGEINDLVAGLPLPATPPTAFAAFADLSWLKFFDLQSSTTNRFNATPLAGALHETVPGPQGNSGGFASNLHNNYIYAALDQELGEVVAFEARVPTAPPTTRGDSTMTGGQVRYWSVCTYDTISQRFFDCLYDENTLVDQQQRGIFLVSRADDRPVNATIECGVNWLPWGPLRNSLVTFRHMLPESGFEQAVQRIPTPPGSCEAPVMGEYFPYGRHYSKADFEALGCPVSPDAIPDRATQFDPGPDCPQDATGEIHSLGAP